MRILFQSIYYQFLVSLRKKQAVFFGMVFPIFLFVVFGSIWGKGNDKFISFLLTGIIGMTIANDGLFAIGPIVKIYYSRGLIKYFRKLPINILTHFIGLIISRVLSVIIIVSLLCITAYFMFNYIISSFEIINYIIGVFIGLFVFSFLGLVITFLDIKKEADSGIIQFVYFLILFTSNALYPVGQFNKLIGDIGDYMPLNSILSILRGDGVINYISLSLWIILPIILFVFLFKNVKYKR